MASTRCSPASLLSIPFQLRRIILVIVPRLFNKRFAFALASVAVIVTKLVHVYAHLDALPTTDLFQWGISFFLQDTAVLLVLRLLVDGQLLATILASLMSAFILTLALISLSFFATAGLELQWRNITLVGDSSSWGMLGTGLVSLALIAGGLCTIAAVFHILCYAMAGMALDILKWPMTTLFRKLSKWRRREPLESEYKNLPQQENGDIPDNDTKNELYWNSSEKDLPLGPRRSVTFFYIVIGIMLLAQVVTTIFRPVDSSLIYMSWTLPLMPFVDFSHSKPTLSSLLAFSSNINGTLENCTALDQPLLFSWLPTETPLPGFEDWYDNKTHYSAVADPLKISNLDNQLLPALRNIDLSDILIRHVLLIKLESTRKDVFPFKKNGVAWNRLSSTFKDRALPKEAQHFLASLTPTAKYLTGDYDDGFDSNEAKNEEPKRRGGINCNNAFTTSTYTLKSLTGTFCGLIPLAADFNVEESHHIYQPCLPHIFNAFNNIDHTAETTTGKEFTSSNWTSSFMQSVTFRYDKQDKLMPMFGFPDQNLWDWWKLTDSPKFGPLNISDINYYGMPEVAVEDYIRDAFVQAKEKHERVFLGHLTSTTHHDFGLPEDEKFVSLTDDEEWNDLSRYLNTVGYVDRWLKKILGILDEQGVANETLVVFVGDHGLSIAERGTITPYSNPHVANYHVPLVISHPQLPNIDINDATHSLQILPTILDLLVETGSLSKSDIKAARDLMRNYEGQSLIRPLRTFSEENGQGAWQFTVMNPGGSTLSVRDARQPNWRLIVPVFGNYEWRFTDLEKDPHEKNAVMSFDLKTLMRQVGSENGTDAAKWVEEAAVVTQWWAEENYKRWRYEP